MGSELIGAAGSRSQSSTLDSSVCRRFNDQGLSIIRAVRHSLRIEGRTMRFLLAIPSLACLSIIGLGAHLVLQQAQQVTALSVPTTAVVLEKRLAVHHQRRSGNRTGSSTTAYEPIVKYRYRVQDRELTSEAIFPDTFRIGGNLGLIAARAPLDQFKVGQQTIAYYNPQDPTEACLIRRPLTHYYAFALLPMIVVSGLVVVWPVSPSNRALAKRWKARGIAVAWHTLGIVAATHYFTLAGSNYSGAALALFGLYAQLGLIPLLVNVESEKPSIVLSRLQSAMSGSLIGTFLGFWLGLAIGLVAIVFGASPSATLKCFGYTPAVTAGLFGLLLSMGTSSGRPDGNQSKTPPARRNRNRRRKSASKDERLAPKPPATASIPYRIDQRPLPSGEEPDVLLPVEVGPFRRAWVDRRNDRRNMPIYAQYESDDGEIFVELGIHDDPAKAQQGVKTAQAETEAEFPDAFVQISLETEPSFFKTSTQLGAFMAWTRGGYYFSAHAQNGEPVLNRFVDEFPY
jgi:hypothetical protein